MNVEHEIEVKAISPIILIKSARNKSFNLLITDRSFQTGRGCSIVLEYTILNKNYEKIRI